MVNSICREGGRGGERGAIYDRVRLRGNYAFNSTFIQFTACLSMA